MQVRFLLGVPRPALSKSIFRQGRSYRSPRFPRRRSLKMDSAGAGMRMKHEADIAYPIPEAGAGKIRIYKQKSPPYVLLGKSTGMESLPTGIPIFLEKREGPPAARRKVTPLRRSSRQCGPIVSKPRNQRVERLGERGVLAAFFMPRHRPPVVSVA